MSPIKQASRPMIFPSPRLVLPGRVTRLVEAYQASNARTQRQWVLLFLLAMVALGMVAGMYLSVSARAAVTGREIQSLEMEISQNQRVNSDLSARLATLLSAETMQSRARTLGFRPVEKDDVQYVVIAGYVPAAPVNLSVPQDPAQGLLVSPAFTQSLFEWLNEQMETAAVPLVEVRQP